MTGIVIDLLGLLKRRTAIKQATDENKNLEVGVLVLKTDDREIVREKMRVDAYWNDMSIIKLFADLGFCAIDVFHLDVHEGYQTCLGLASGIISFSKLWVKTRDSK